MSSVSLPRQSISAGRVLANTHVNEAIVNWAVLALVLAQGAFLRLWQINALGLNSDEAVYAGQAASIAQIPEYTPYFPIFRAHPLLAQFILAIGFHWGVTDILPRLVAVAFGLAAIVLVYMTGSLLYSPRTGLLAALFVSFMPYHVVVSRQFLLDGPMMTCATLTLYLLARYGLTQRAVWLYAAGIGMGLTFLAKETGIILVGAVYAFVALSPEIRTRLRDLVIAMVCMVLVMAPFPLSLILAGGSKTGNSYLAWQLLRRPNHDWDFYLSTVPNAIGWLVILVAFAGLILLRRQNSWREKLLGAWIAVPVIFFQLYPVKGFQYLLPIAPAFALLAGRPLGEWTFAQDATVFARRIQLSWVRALVVGAIALTMLITSWMRVQAAVSDQFLAGSGGVPGGREAGLWVADHIPQGAKLMAIGPSMANIIQFYGHRKVYGLSVSPNPVHRNPSYEPVINPDLQIRHGDLNYLIWDSFSGTRTPFFVDALMKYVKRYNGRVVHTEYVQATTPDGSPTLKPVIIIYEVRP